MIEKLTGFAEFKAASDDLRHRRAQGLSDSEFKTDLMVFMESGQAAGTFLEGKDERQRAQYILDMWSVELVTLGDFSENTSALPKLAAYAGGESEATMPPDAAQRLDEGRELVRLAATARQWQENGRDKGYLLYGDALERARALAKSDRDIKELVDASDEEVGKKSDRRKRVNRWVIGLMAVVIALLAMSTIFAVHKMNQAREAAADAIAQTNAADQQAQLADTENERLTAANDLAAARYAELAALQSRLDIVARALNTAAADGSLNRRSAPRPIVELLSPEAARNTFVFPATDSPLLNGYNPDFLDIRVGVPRLSPELKATAFNNGQVLPYTNYSVIFDQAKRLPIIAMSNIDRSGLGIYPRVGFELTFDPRLPREIQSAPSPLAAGTFIDGQLTTPREIAWGATSNDSDSLYEGMTSVYSNTVPLTYELNRTVWGQLQDYAIDKFGEGSPKVSIFSGPAFSAPPSDGSGTVRDYYWKVFISTRSDRKQPELIVEAYLLPQDDPAGFPDALTAIFDRYRVHVTDIELLTGLDFGEDIRATDARSNFVQRQMVRGSDTLPLLLNSVINGESDSATRTRNTLVRFLARQSTSAESRNVVVSSLAALARSEDAKSGPLLPANRGAILAILATVPAEDWAATEWQDSRAAARRIVGDWTRGDAPPLDQAAVDAIAQLKPLLAFAPESGPIVHFQFAGFTRNKAEAISQDLQALGWSIPGEERLREAAGKSEVRYAPNDDGDRGRAELLAADIRALDWVQVTAVPNSYVRPGTLEIWISN